MLWLQQRFPNLTIKGIEPVEALRSQGFKKGISNKDLLPGVVCALEFPDSHFDMVCEFAVLHQSEIRSVQYARCHVWRHA
jgi:hypothetical protein